MVYSETLNMLLFILQSYFQVWNCDSTPWLLYHDLQDCYYPDGILSYVFAYFTILFSGVGLTRQLGCYTMAFRTTMYPDGILSSCCLFYNLDCYYIMTFILIVYSHVFVVYFTILFSGVGL